MFYMVQKNKHESQKKRTYFMKKLLLAVATLSTVAAFATPVEVDWKAGETMPSAVARPYCGFLPDGKFLLVGGSNFENDKKVYYPYIYLRALDGTWKKLNELPIGVADGVSCETPRGVFCAGGTDGVTTFSEAFIMSVSPSSSRKRNARRSGSSLDAASSYLAAVFSEIPLLCR